ncbi:MAG: GDP-L-fucose synthase [Desulfobacteraceae bacterium]|nr:GDP-L-fucose synthase [Desulfobacteraceae bacterium]
MEATSHIYIAGHDGLVGSALVRKFNQKGFKNLITRHHTEVDLRRQAEVEAFFEQEQPEFVVLAAAKVGGILANNTYPAEFIYDNLAIQTNIIHAAWKTGVKRLIFLGSSCIYPRECPQPMKEDYLLTGPLESTNEPYAIAKIAGIKMCQSYNRQYGTRYFALMPTNLYGPNDNFNLETSHVLPALIRKFHDAKTEKAESVTVWGTGSPRREFLHVDDLADACLHIINLDEAAFSSLISDTAAPLVNIGCGQDHTIRELAELIGQIVDFAGRLVFDTTKPDGTPQKLLDVSLLARLGWRQTISLEQGIAATYEWCLNNRVF